MPTVFHSEPMVRERVTNSLTNPNARMYFGPIPAGEPDLVDAVVEIVLERGWPELHALALFTGRSKCPCNLCQGQCPDVLPNLKES